MHREGTTRGRRDTNRGTGSRGERFVAELDARGRKWRGHPYKGAGQCPSHDDGNPSLTWEEGSDGRLLIHCHGGCDERDVVHSIGWTLADLFPHGHHRAGPARQPRVRTEQPVVSLLTVLATAGIGYTTTANADLLVADQCPACHTPALWIHHDRPQGLRVACWQGCDADRVLDALKQRATGQGVPRAA